MFCQRCRVSFPRKNWPPQRTGMVAFAGLAALQMQGYFLDKQPVWWDVPADLSHVRIQGPLIFDSADLEENYE